MSPLRELQQRMQFKVAENSHYQFFMGDLERVQAEINRQVKDCLQKICSAENDIKMEKGPAEFDKTSAALSEDLILLKHHCSGAKAATQRFAGILGIEPPKTK